MARRWAVILVVAFPINCLRVLFLAGYTAAVPGLVGRAQVGRATSTFEAVYNVGFVVGPGHRRRAGRSHRPGPHDRGRRGLVRDLELPPWSSSGGR